MLSYVLHLTLNTGLESIVQEDRGCPADVYDGVAVLCFESLDEMAAKERSRRRSPRPKSWRRMSVGLLIMPRAGSGSPSTTPSSDRLWWGARDAADALPGSVATRSETKPRMILLGSPPSPCRPGGEQAAVADGQTSQHSRMNAANMRSPVPVRCSVHR